MVFLPLLTLCRIEKDIYHTPQHIDKHTSTLQKASLSASLSRFFDFSSLTVRWEIFQPASSRERDSLAPPPLYCSVLPFSPIGLFSFRRIKGDLPSCLLLPHPYQISPSSSLSFNLPLTLDLFFHHHSKSNIFSKTTLSLTSSCPSSYPK